MRYYYIQNPYSSLGTHSDADAAVVVVVVVVPTPPQDIDVISKIVTSKQSVLYVVYRVDWLRYGVKS